VGGLLGIEKDETVDSDWMCVVCEWDCVLGVAGEEKTSMSY